MKSIVPKLSSNPSKIWNKILNLAAKSNEILKITPKK